MTTERVAERPNATPLLRQRVFVSLLMTALVSNVGSWMQGFSEQWLVVQMAGAAAPRWAGRQGFASGFAMLLLIPLAGALGDRFDRRRLLALSQAWLMGIAVVMGTLALTPNGLTLVRLVAFAGATGVGMALMVPMLNSLLPGVVTRDELTAASGLMSAQFNVSRVVGPTLSAVVLSWWGASGNFFLNALSFVGLIFVSFRLPAPVQEEGGAGRGSYAEAWNHCREDRELRVALILALVVGTFAWSYHTFVTVYAVRYLGAQAHGAAGLLAAYGVGAISGSLLLSRDTGGSPWRRLRIGLAAYGMGLVLVGAWPHDVVTLTVAAGLGGAHAVFGNLLSVAVQHRAPEAMRGRITAIYLMAILGTTPLGNLAAGEVAQALGYHGVRWVLGAQGVLLIGSAMWAGRRMASKVM